MNNSIVCKTWQETDLPNLLSYLQHLDNETRERFAPHAFNLQTLIELFHHPSYEGYLLIEPQSSFIIGYAITHLGYFGHDLSRYNQYTLLNHHYSSAMYAPSLASEWRGKGVGKLFWQFIQTDLLHKQIKQVLLWGGVQAQNEIAVRYYHSLGFQTLGEFEMNGKANIDMVKLL